MPDSVLFKLLRLIKALVSCYLCLLLIIGVGKVWAQNISLDVVINSGEQREAFRNLIEAFELANPDINVKLNARSAVAHKAKIDEWEAAGAIESDVFYWFAGNRMKRLSSPGLVKPITSMWNAQDLDQSFDHRVKRLVTDAGEVYGMPFAFYQWGFYFSTSLLERFGFEPPQTWDELKALCETLKANNLYCFALGVQEPWALGAWFDYLNLRLNGLNRHLDTLNGRKPFNSDAVKLVLEHWKSLVDAGYFVPGEGERNWQESLPHIFRGEAAMILMGNFVGSVLPERFAKDISYTPFPDIRSDLGRFENAPLDVFLVSSSTKNPEASERLMAFISRAEAQHNLNASLHTFSPHTDSGHSSCRFSEGGQRTLSEAKGFAQFLDRDANKAYADLILNTLVQFHAGELSIAETMEKVEAQRQSLHPEY